MDEIRLIPEDDPSLYEAIANNIPEDRIEACVLFGNLMVKVLNSSMKSGIALAAPQVGIRERFFVFSNGRMFLNPKITSPISTKSKTLPKYFDKPTFLDGEGCLSFPSKRVVVPRWEKIRANWTDENRVVHTNERLSGIASHIFQHELDHLNGVCIVPRLTT